jgi:hypothetical protein
MECPITLEPIPPEYTVTIGSNTYDARALDNYIRTNQDALDPMTRNVITPEQKLLVAKIASGERDDVLIESMSTPDLRVRLAELAREFKELSDCTDFEIKLAVVDKMGDVERLIRNRGATQTSSGNTVVVGTIDENKQAEIARREQERVQREQERAQREQERVQREQERVQREQERVQREQERVQREIERAHREIDRARREVERAQREVERAQREVTRRLDVAQRPHTSPSSPDGSISSITTDGSGSVTIHGNIRGSVTTTASGGTVYVHSSGMRLETDPSSPYYGSLVSR